MVCTASVSKPITYDKGLTQIYLWISLYYWQLHYILMKESNNNFLVGFPTWKFAKTFMLLAISTKYHVSFEETELAWLQYTLKPDPFWKEWEEKTTHNMPTYF